MGADSTLRNTALEAHAPSPLPDKTGKDGDHQAPPGSSWASGPQFGPHRSLVPKAPVSSERPAGAFLGTFPQGFGARHPPGARFLHTGGRSGDRLLTCGRQALGSAA